VAWLSTLLLIAVLVPLLPLPYPAGVPDLQHIALPPFAAGQHWLGTDSQGRDVLSGLLFGTRTALFLTVPATFLAALLGALAGGAAGYWGNGLRVGWPAALAAVASGWWALRLPYGPLSLAIATGAALLIMTAWWHRKPWKLQLRIPINSIVLGAIATLGTVPRLVLVIALAAGNRLSAASLLLVFTLTSWPRSARLVRAQMLRVRVLPHLEAARALGLPTPRLLWRHAFPFALQPLKTDIALSICDLLALESTLSFLGIGLAPEVASWGQMLATARQDSSLWWAYAPAAIMLFISILSVYSLTNSFVTPTVSVLSSQSPQHSTAFLKQV
jgi:peptide/nickel transport system permease protein